MFTKQAKRPKYNKTSLSIFTQYMGQVKTKHDEQKDKDQDFWLKFAGEGLWTERGANDFNNQYYKV